MIEEPRQTVHLAEDGHLSLGNSRIHDIRPLMSLSRTEGVFETIQYQDGTRNSVPSSTFNTYLKQHDEQDFILVEISSFSGHRIPPEFSRCYVSVGSLTTETFIEEDSIRSRYMEHSYKILGDAVTDPLVQTSAVFNASQGLLGFLCTTSDQQLKVCYLEKINTPQSSLVARPVVSIKKAD